MVSELPGTPAEPTDALWDAITWYAFVDGLMARTEGSDHVKGAYTIFAAPGLGGERVAFEPAETDGAAVE